MFVFSFVELSIPILWPFIFQVITLFLIDLQILYILWVLTIRDISGFFFSDFCFLIEYMFLYN